MVAFVLFLDCDRCSVGLDICNTTVRLVEPHVFLVLCVGDLFVAYYLVNLLDIAESAVAYLNSDRLRWFGGCRHSGDDK